MEKFMWITIGYVFLSGGIGIWFKALGNSKRERTMEMDDDLKELERQKNLVIRGQTQIGVFNKQIPLIQEYLDVQISALEKSRLASMYEDAVAAHKAAQADNNKWLAATATIRERMRLEAEKRRREEEERRRKEEAEEAKRRKKRQEEEDAERERNRRNSYSGGGGYSGGYSGGGGDGGGGGFSGGGGSSSGGGGDGSW